MNFKKNLLSILILLFYTSSYSLSFEDLINLTLESNSDINSAQTAYKKGKLSSKLLDGSYAPQLILSSSTTIPKKYGWDSIPNYFSSDISYIQPLPGGAIFSINTSYSFNSYNLLAQEILTQSQNISLSLSQSLLPFWIQGKIQDPVKLSLEHQEKYLYYQFLYIKKNVLLNLFQNYLYAAIALNEIAIYQNTIELYEQQIESFKELLSLGKTSQSAILEIENLKWNSQQSLMNAQTQYIDCIQKMESICGKNFDDITLSFTISDNFEKTFLDIIESYIDPLEQTYQIKLQLLESSRISEKQASAPIINFTVQPKLDSTTTAKDSWKTAWEDFPNTSSWNFSLGINFTPLFSGVSKYNKEKYQLDYTEAEKSYKAYLTQRAFVRQQYNVLLEHYTNQNGIIASLYESGLKEYQDLRKQYEADLISKLDLESARVRIENLNFTKKYVGLYVWMYKILIQVN